MKGTAWTAYVSDALTRLSKYEQGQFNIPTREVPGVVLQEAGDVLEDVLVDELVQD